jgi:hypothetical protein
MKISQYRKPRMKNFFSTAILVSFLWSTDRNLALAQPATASALPDANEGPQQPGVLPAPSADQPGGVPGAGRSFGGGGFGGAGQTAANYSADTKAYGYHAAAAGPAIIIQFSQSDPRSVDVLQEDLNVMSLLLQKRLEDAVGENSPTYRMGIPLLLRSGKHGIDSLYIDGFGALFTMTVNFPLVAPPSIKAKETDDTTGSDEWDKARKELYGVRESEEAANPYGRSGLPYDAAQVGALKRALLEALKNVTNIRDLKPEEWIVASVFGAESPDTSPGLAGGSGGGGVGVGGTTGRAGRGASNVAQADARILEAMGVGMPESRTGRGTVLTVRVRKSDADSLAKGKMSFEQFEQKATIAAYLGPATHGSSDFFRGASYPGRYPVPPAKW